MPATCQGFIIKIMVGSRLRVKYLLDVEVARISIKAISSYMFLDNGN